MKSRNLEAWDERFDHIDNFHFKHGESIDEWYPLDKDIPKGFLRSDNVLDSGGPSIVPDQNDSDEDETSGEAGEDSPSQEMQIDAPDIIQLDSNKHNQNVEAQSEFRSKKQREWYCVCFG